MTLSPLAAASIISLAALQQAGEDHKLASFHDDRSEVTITYPDLLVPKNFSEREAAVAQSNNKLKASQPDKAVSVSSDSIPFLATTPPGAPFAMIQFSRFDGKSINRPNVDAGLRDLATGMMKTFANALLNAHDDTIVPVDLGEHNGMALFGSGQLKSNNAEKMYVAVVCFSNSGQDDCLCEVSFDKTTLLELLHDPIQFDGESGRPLIQKPIDF